MDPTVPEPIDPRFIKVLIVAIPILLGPLVTWVLNRSGYAAKSREMDYYLKRLELATKLREYRQKFEEKTAASRKWAIVDTEVSQILAFIHPEEGAEGRRVDPQPKDMPILRWLFLLFKPLSVGGWVLHILFYYSLSLAVVIPLLYSTFAIELSKEASEVFAPSIFSFLSYLGFAILLRYFALRSYRKQLEKHALESKMEADEPSVEGPGSPAST